MICADCAFAADLRVSTGNAQAAADAEARAWHEQCQMRNAGREHGQLPDCMCQHESRAVNAEPEDVTHGR